MSFYQPSFLFTYTAVCSGNINSLTHFRSWQNYDLKLEHSSHSLKYWNANDADSKRQRRWLTVKAKLNDPPPAELEVLISFFFLPESDLSVIGWSAGLHHRSLKSARQTPARSVSPLAPSLSIVFFFFFFCTLYFWWELNKVEYFSFILLK